MNQKINELQDQKRKALQLAMDGEIQVNKGKKKNKKAAIEKLEQLDLNAELEKINKEWEEERQRLTAQKDKLQEECGALQLKVKEKKEREQ